MKLFSHTTSQIGVSLSLEIETSGLECFLPFSVPLLPLNFPSSPLPPDHERVALGNEEGLFVIHVTKDGKIHCNGCFLDHLFGSF